MPKTRKGPVYFHLNVPGNKKLNSNSFWNSRQNTDLGKWIRHRRNVELKAKPTIDNKLSQLYLENAERSKKSKQNLEKRQEEKRKLEILKLKERCSKVQGFCTAQKWEKEFTVHKNVCSKLSKTVKPDPQTPRNVKIELRQKTPPLKTKKIPSVKEKESTSTTLTNTADMPQ